MKITELIKKLNTLKKKHGNLDVLVVDTGGKLNPRPSMRHIPYLESSDFDKIYDEEKVIMLN